MAELFLLSILRGKQCEVRSRPGVSRNAMTTTWRSQILPKLGKLWTVPRDGNIFGVPHLPIHHNGLSGFVETVSQDKVVQFSSDGSIQGDRHEEETALTSSPKNYKGADAVPADW